MNKKLLAANYISSFCMELYLTVGAGIPVSEGIWILMEGEEDSRLKSLLSGVYDQLLMGGELNTALEQSGAFPKHMTDMIRVGEQTGKLESTLRALSDYYDRQERLSKTIQSAVLYPAILLVMMILVVIILIVKVLPIFRDVFAQLGGTMSGIAAGVLKFGELMQDYWLAAFLIPLAVVAVLIVWVVRSSRGGERVLLSKKLGEGSAAAKLASVLALSLQSGLDPDMSLEMAEGMMEHSGMRDKLKRCRSRMLEGEGFAEALSAEKVFSGLHCRMLSVGIKTGTVDSVMEEIARRSGENAEDAIEQRVGSVEPALVIIMSVLVGVILLAVMLPLADIMSSLG